MLNCILRRTSVFFCKSLTCLNVFFSLAIRTSSMTWMLVFLKKDECMERCAHPSPFISLDRSSSAALSSARTPPNDNTWWQQLKVKDLLVMPSLLRHSGLIYSKVVNKYTKNVHDVNFVTFSYISLNCSSSAILSLAQTLPNDNTWWQLLKMKDRLIIHP